MDHQLLQNAPLNEDKKDSLISQSSLSSRNPILQNDFIPSITSAIEQKPMISTPNIAEEQKIVDSPPPSHHITTKNLIDEQKQKGYVPKFSEKWALKGTLKYKPLINESSKGNNYFFCLVCQKDYKVSYLYGTNNHFKTQLHIDNELSIKDLGIEEETDLIESIEKKAICFYFNFISFLSQKNLPIAMADEIAEFMKSNIEDSKVLKAVTIYEKKTRLLLNNGIKEMIHKNPDQRLEGKFWSSLIDECIDRSTTKVYATFVQF